jgi:hypothetical protein
VTKLDVPQTNTTPNWSGSMMDTKSILKKAEQQQACQKVPKKGF